MRRNPYLPLLERRHPQAEVTLFCLPHAGGSASTYADWGGTFPDWVDVQPVELPGRGSLMSRPLITDVDLLVGTLARALLPAIDRPFALFGHSMGGMVAAELTSWLHRYGHPLPGSLTVSGRSGRPYFPHAKETVGLTDEDLTRWILALGGTDPLVLMDPHILTVTIRAMRADMTLCSAYERTFHRLPVPLLAVGGSDDPAVSPAELELWRELSGRCRCVTLPGGHFYYQDQLPELAGLIVDELRQMPELTGVPAVLDGR